MLTLSVQPNVIDPGSPAQVIVQGLGSGFSYSGVAVSIGAYQTGDVAFATPTNLRNVILDANGQAAFQQVGGNFGGSGPFNYAVIGGRDRGVQSMDVSLVGALALLLDDTLCAFRHIDRFEEPLRVSEDGTVAKAGWGNWHFDREPTILRFDRWVPNTNVTIDYQTGKVYFPVPIGPGEDVRASYSFRMLDLSIYRSFLTLAIGILNNRKPQTGYDLTNFPMAFATLMVLYAYIESCKMLLAKMNTFAYRRVFENPDGLSTALQQMMTSAQSKFDSEIGTLKRRGMIQPAAISTFNIGRQGTFLVDEINIQNFIVSR